MNIEELTPEEQAQAKEFWRLTKQPPEYFDSIVNSGMCNSIIKGYILLALDELGRADQGAEIDRVAAHIFDDYSAEDAREREQRG